MKIENISEFGLRQNDVRLFALSDFPEVSQGIDVANVIVEKAGEIGGLQNGDIVFIASKIISKAENLIVDLRNVVVGDEAVELSKISGKPASVCQVIIDNCQNVHIVNDGKTILAENSQRILSTSGGIDKLDEHHVTLLPTDPDGIATVIREKINTEIDVDVAVVIVDSDGLPQWKGAISIPIGSSGIAPIRSTVGYDPILKTPKQQDENVIFMLANAAGYLLGQRGKGTPVVILRGDISERNSSLGVKDAIHGN